MNPNMAVKVREFKREDEAEAMKLAQLYVDAGNPVSIEGPWSGEGHYIVTVYALAERKQR
jgi:hypothetical protein